MSFVRALIHDHRRLALLLILCALLAKALVPSGYMLGSSTTLTVELCADGLDAKVSKQIEIPMQGGSHSNSDDQGKAEGTCAFSSLAMAGMAGADGLQLALALAFILVLGFAPVTLPRTTRVSHLRPPLRGPPALA